jgi:hypothetical protein
MFPKPNRAGDVFRREKYTGIRIDNQRYSKLRFGQYVQVSANSDITDTMKPYKYGEISSWVL